MDLRFKCEAYFQELRFIYPIWRRVQASSEAVAWDEPAIVLLAMFFS
jgi:hypothetical protein